MGGQVEAIHICPAAGAPMLALPEVEALAGVGLAGDRYATGAGYYSARPRADGGRELTLMAAEVLDWLLAEHGIVLTAAESRRNLSVRGLDLGSLLGRRFTIGEVECEGVDDCPPCQHLVEVTGKAVLAPLVGRGGVRARIVRGGRLRVGATVALAEAVAGTGRARAG